MTAPSRADVGAMANILKAMKGDKTSLRESTEAQTQGGEVDLSPGVKKSDIKAMENIMKNFSSATSNVAKKIATTINESKKTEKGVQVGIIKDSRTNDTLFEAIRLYETAYIIVKHLNEGKKINSEEITKIISANAVFEKYYYDALQHRHTYRAAKKRGDYGRMDISEARFSRAKMEANTARKTIFKIFEAVDSKK
mgnify:CR=1 FL=1